MKVNISISASTMARAAAVARALHAAASVPVQNALADVANVPRDAAAQTRPAATPADPVQVPPEDPERLFALRDMIQILPRVDGTFDSDWLACLPADDAMHPDRTVDVQHAMLSLAFVPEGRWDDEDLEPISPLPDLLSDLDLEGTELDRLVALEQEDGRDPAAAFQRFLTRLEATINAKRQPDFASEMSAWRARVERDPHLLEVTHMFAEGATGSCQDRITHTYLQMRRAESTLAIDAGHFDHDAEALVAMARQTMRDERVDQLAQERIRQFEMHSIAYDEVEAFLHYRFGMGALLLQPGGVREGVYAITENSGVTEEDLDEARVAVQRMDTEFPSFLSNWPVWQRLQQRLYPEAFAAAEALRAESSDPDAFRGRVRAFLQAERPGFEDDADAQREAGPMVTAQLNHDVFWPLTQRFLQERGASLG